MSTKTEEPQAEDNTLKAEDNTLKAEDNTFKNGVKLAGEAFVLPGSSLLLDGNLTAGGLHLAGAYVASALIGPIGWVLVAANSFSKSTTDKHLVGHLKGA
jgi:hypothetical protein